MTTSGLFRVEPDAALNVIRPAAEQTPIMPSGPAFHFPQGPPRRAAPSAGGIPGLARSERLQPDTTEDEPAPLVPRHAHPDAPNGPPLGDGALQQRH